MTARYIPTIDSLTLRTPERLELARLRGEYLALATRRRNGGGRAGRRQGDLRRLAAWSALSSFVDRVVAREVHL